jgi:hypothetical protein
MKHAIVLLTMVAALGCASTKDSGPPVSVHLAALDTNSSSFFFRGPIGLRYAVEVSNPADETVTLRRLDLHSAGGGAYSIRADSTPMNLKVAAKSNATFAINTWGRSRGGDFRADEPVVILGRAYFDSPKGPFVKVFQENVVPNP